MHWLMTRDFLSPKISISRPYHAVIRVEVPFSFVDTIFRKNGCIPHPQESYLVVVLIDARSQINHCGRHSTRIHSFSCIAARIDF